MPAASDKIMFEIYREDGYDRQFRVVYFTELDDHNKEREISSAMSGEHFFDGFIHEGRKEEGKQKIADILSRLNAGEALSAEVAAAELSNLDLLAPP